MIAVRTLQPDDNDRYRALWLLGITEHQACFRTAPEDDLPAGIPTQFTADSFTLGAFSGDEMVGIVSCERERGAKLLHKALVSRMFVHPDFAGKGVGSALLRHLMTSAADIAGLRYLYLTVLASNERAIKLYQSFNFVMFAHESGSVKIDGRYVDELKMACSLLAA